MPRSPDIISMAQYILIKEILLNTDLLNTQGKLNRALILFDMTQNKA